MPASLVAEIDRLSGPGRGSRSRFISEATAHFLEARRRQLEERLRMGYIEMAPINTALAEEALLVENESYSLAAGRPMEAD